MVQLEPHQPSRAAMEAQETTLSLKVASSTVVGIVIAVIVILTGRVANWVWRWGHMVQVAKSKPINLDDNIIPRVLPFHHQLIQNYGKNSIMWFGSNPVLTIMNPEDIKEVFTNISVFQKIPTNPLTKPLITGLVGYEAFYESCNEMVEKWMRLESESQRNYCEIDVWPFFQSMANDVISRTAFEVVMKKDDIYSNFNLNKLFLPSRFVPTKLNRRLKEIEKEIELLVRGIIHKREKAREEELAPSDDLLDILLESNRREIKDNSNNKNVGMSIEDVIKECKLFYVLSRTRDNLCSP
ncbi:hypothetical protein K1719_034549 [Acacia pycnantha]|nr:hypothetical protein K1719_034549 [Acacia pycnantha]